MAQRDKDVKNFYTKIGVVFGTGVVLALVIFLGILPLINYLGKPAYLDIMVEPAEAKVEIGSQEYASNAVYEMEPGAYTATVRLGELEPEVVDLNLVKNQTTGLYLQWTEDCGWRLYTAEELKRKNAIAEIMPLKLSICGVPAKRTNCDAIAIYYDREAKCGGEKCLVINGRRAELTDETLDAVRGELEARGYSLGDYKYIYMQNDER